jgi:hypothetical protein
MKIDNPYNNTLKDGTTSTGNPGILKTYNYPIFGDIAEFMHRKMSKLFIKAKNLPPTDL